LRALVARDADNLLAAGRCLSCDHEAQAALRVIGTCLATGEAAGLMAGRAATGAGSLPASPRRAAEEATGVAEARRRVIEPVAEPWTELARRQPVVS